MAKDGVDHARTVARARQVRDQTRGCTTRVYTRAVTRSPWIAVLALVSVPATTGAEMPEPHPEPAPQSEPRTMQVPVPEPELEAERAPPPRPPTPFDRGKVGLSIGGGSQTSLGHRYFAIGGGVGYFVLDGVELGLAGLHQFGDGPSISKLTPSLRYIAQPLVGRWPLIPYVGGFYNHWFIGDDIDDVDTVGTRGGLVFISGQLVLGVGVVYEHIVSTCSDDCDAIYPDFTISLAL
jgi:hypothetical protein